MLTMAPAHRFGQDKQTGQIAVGFDADLVLLKGDPAADVQNFDRVVLTLRQGKVLYDKNRVLIFYGEGVYKEGSVRAY